MEHIGVHAMLERQCCNGSAGHSAGCCQFGFELRAVGAVGTPLGVARSLRVFEHRVHPNVACTRSCSPSLDCSRWVGWTLRRYGRQPPNGVNHEKSPGTCRCRGWGGDAGQASTAGGVQAPNTLNTPAVFTMAASSALLTPTSTMAAWLTPTPASASKITRESAPVLPLAPTVNTPPV